MKFFTALFLFLALVSVSLAGNKAQKKDSKSASHNGLTNAHQDKHHLEEPSRGYNGWVVYLLNQILNTLRQIQMDLGDRDNDQETNPASTEAAIEPTWVTAEDTSEPALITTEYVPTSTAEVEEPPIVPDEGLEPASTPTSRARLAHGNSKAKSAKKSNSKSKKSHSKSKNHAKGHSKSHSEKKH